MINPKKNRYIYSDILTPPYGYELEKAIATTYSLDIPALVSCMIPLAFSADVDNRLFKNKVCNLTALRNLSDKMVVFCDPGQLKNVSSKNSEFALLLEKMIIPVNLPPINSNDYPAFHPKMWLLQFVNKDGNHKYKFIVLSRNISYDKCYDVTFVLESSDNHLKTRKTNPIVDFLRFLNDQIDLTNFNRLGKQKTIIQDLVNDLINEKICFSLMNEQYADDDFEIFPLFNSEYRKRITNKLFEDKNEEEKEKLDDMFIMSPFITPKILDDFRQCIKETSTPKFFTRKQALEGLSENYNSSFDFFAMSDVAILGEDFSTEDADEKKEENEEDESFDKLRDIHAKLFLTQKKKHSDLYIGSANATYSAFNKNIELMVRIGTEKKYLNVESFVNELNPDGNGMFEKVQIQEKQTPDSTVQQLAENYLKKLCHLQASAEVLNNSDNYSIELIIHEYPEINEQFTTYISPLTYKQDKHIEQRIVFTDLPVTALSEFFLIKVEYTDNDEVHVLERVIKIPTKNIPYEERDSKIVSNLIKDRDTFAEYVTLLLSKDYIATQTELVDLKESNAKWKISNTQSPLYEMLLQACVHNPSAVRSLKEEMNLIKNDSIITPEFRQMYEQFLKVVDKGSKK